MPYKKAFLSHAHSFSGAFLKLGFIQDFHSREGGRHCLALKVALARFPREKMVGEGGGILWRFLSGGKWESHPTGGSREYE